MIHELTLKDKIDFLQSGKDIDGKSGYVWFHFPREGQSDRGFLNGHMSQFAASWTVRSHQQPFSMQLVIQGTKLYCHTNCGSLHEQTQVLKVKSSIRWRGWATCLKTVNFISLQTSAIFLVFRSARPVCNKKHSDAPEKPSGRHRSFALSVPV